MTSAPVIHLRPNPDEEQRWFMELEDVPDTPLHDAIIALLILIFQHRYRDRDVLVARNLGCRWAPDDARIGVDPDVALIEPAPPKGISTLRVWEPGHSPPRIAIEVVSENNAAKDYMEGPPRIARLGGEELVIFDPELHGPTAEEHGGPFVLQIWRRATDGQLVDMVRTYAGDGPAFSTVLNAWLVPTDDGERLRVADDELGNRLWPTEAEAETEARKAAEAKANEETEARRAAEAEVQRLRALLDKES